MKKDPEEKGEPKRSKRAEAKEERAEGKPAYTATVRAKRKKRRGY
jgi:hypothetical protein